MAPSAALGAAPPDDKVARGTLLRKTMVSVPHFVLDDSDGEDSTDTTTIWEAVDMTLPGASGKGAGLEQFPVDEDSEDSVDGDDWVRIVELLELEDQYQFDPERVAEMVDGGADLQHLSDHLCEAMVSNLEQRASDMEQGAMVSSLGQRTSEVGGLESSVQDDPLMGPAPRAVRSTSDQTDWMRPPLRCSERGSPEPAQDPTDWMRPTPRSSPSRRNLRKNTVAAVAIGSKSAAAAANPDSTSLASAAAASLTSVQEGSEQQESEGLQSPSPTQRPRKRRDAAARALSAARKSLLARCEAGEEVGEKLKLVEEALADAQKRHRSSVAQALLKSYAQGSSDAPEALGGSTESLRESRIQEAVSLAMAMSQTAKEGSHPRRKRPTRRRLALAIEQYQAAPGIQRESKTRQEWIVVGGHDTGGLIVRSGESLQSQAVTTRLSFGARVKCLQVSGKRLHFQKLQGQGPAHGWVSLELAACRSPLVVPLKQKKQRRSTA